MCLSVPFFSPHILSLLYTSLPIQDSIPCPHPSSCHYLLKWFSSSNLSGYWVRVVNETCLFSIYKYESGEKWLICCPSKDPWIQLLAPMWAGSELSIISCQPRCLMPTSGRHKQCNNVTLWLTNKNNKSLKKICIIKIVREQIDKKLKIIYLMPDTYIENIFVFHKKILDHVINKLQNENIKS